MEQGAFKSIFSVMNFTPDSVWARSDYSTLAKTRITEWLRKGPFFKIKVNKNTTTLVRKFFYICPEYLYYTKNEDEEKIQGAAELNWTHVEFSVDNYKDEKLYIIRLIKKNIFAEICTKSLEDFKLWKPIFAKYCL